MADYTTQPADGLADRDRILGLWARGLTHRNQPEAKFDWYYRDNPEGAPHVEYLVHRPTGQAVGVASAGPRRFQRGAEPLAGGAMVDLVVTSEHRTFFPAFVLQRAICRTSLGRLDFLYGFPNPKSEAAIKRAGYRYVGALQRRVRVLRLAPYLARKLPGWLAALAGPVIDAFRLAGLRRRSRSCPDCGSTWLERPDERFDAFWQRAAPQEAVTGVRDRRYLDWRFAQCPMQAHRLFVLSSKADESIVAYAACAMNGGAMTVFDFLVDRSRPEAFERLLAELGLAAHAQGASSLSVLFMGPESVLRRLAASGFVSRGIRPFYAVLPERLAALRDPARWYVTGADDDV